MDYAIIFFKSNCKFAEIADMIIVAAAREENKSIFRVESIEG